MRARTASRAASRSIDDFDAEPVLFQSGDGRRERLLVGQRGEAVRCSGRAHRLVLPWASVRIWRRKRTLPRLYSGRRVGPMNQPVTWGPPPAERADAARNRRLLLATAREIIAEQGADKLTMDGLAERAGLGKGTVFRRFGTRAGIFQALLDDDERAFQEQVLSGRPPLGPGAPPLDRLIAYGRARIDFLIGHRQIARAALDGREHGASRIADAHVAGTHPVPARGDPPRPRRPGRPGHPAHRGPGRPATALPVIRHPYPDRPAGLRTPRPRLGGPDPARLPVAQQTGATAEEEGRRQLSGLITQNEPRRTRPPREPEPPGAHWQPRRHASRVTSWKPGRAGSAGWIWLRQMVARSASRVWKLCTGRPLPVCLAAALARACGERAAGATGLVRAAWAVGLSSSVNSSGASRSCRCQVR